MEERRTGKEPDSLFACRTARAGAFVHLFDYTGNRLESRVGQACHSAATACLRVRYRRVVASSPSSSPSSSPTPSPGAVVAHLQSKERAALVNDAPQSRVTVRPRWQHQVPAVSDPPGIFQGLFQQHDTHSRRPEVSLLQTGRRHPVMESPPLLLRCNTIWSHVTRHPIHGSARILLFALPLREPISSLYRRL